ncbi:MAG: class I SAM-dependent methyltransferase [Methanosarcinaceae archaeon]|nr:class I SAM-dependent methyltransferase [Methanosarcinaceae archaeon]
MRPDDLIMFNFQYYNSPDILKIYSDDATIDQGLWPDEQDMLLKVPLKGGQLAILGVGGGRVAIHLARMGFEVTGVDFVSEMVVRAQHNAEKRGVRIRGIVQELTRLDLETSSYDAVWLPASLYSYIPTRTKRLTVIKCIYRALRPGGYFFCRFICDQSGSFNSSIEALKKGFALIFFGNRQYERGDMLLNNREFVHVFPAEADLTSEFSEGGFEIVFMNIQKDSKRGQAILKKA